MLINIFLFKMINALIDNKVMSKMQERKHYKTLQTKFTKAGTNEA